MSLPYCPPVKSVTKSWRWLFPSQLISIWDSSEASVLSLNIPSIMDSSMVGRGKDNFDPPQLYLLSFKNEFNESDNTSIHRQERQCKTTEDWSVSTLKSINLRILCCGNGNKSHFESFKKKLKCTCVLCHARIFFLDFSSPFISFHQNHITSMIK